MKRVTVYCPKDLYCKLRKVLSDEGRSVSSWFRLEANKKVAAGATFFGIGIIGLMGFNYIQQEKPVPKDYNCADFRTWAEAQEKFDSVAGDPYGLDKNGDGIACEGLRK